MDDQEELQKSITAGARLVGTVIGCVFGGIGLLVLGFLWSQPFGEFHSPPLFFRLFGSMIAIPFVLIGGFTAVKSLTATGGNRSGRKSSRKSPPKQKRKYVCPHCNAPIGEDSDVSPHGDVKCSYCKSWFNIHDA
jgi:DNA-directed RNA polymerase subunit RPC12/RpoP